MRCVVKFQVLNVNRTPMSRLTCPTQTDLPRNRKGTNHNRRCNRSLIECRLRCRARSWLRPNKYSELTGEYRYCEPSRKARVVFQQVARVIVSVSSQREANAPISVSKSPITT